MRYFFLLIVAKKQEFIMRSVSRNDSVTIRDI